MRKICAKMVPKNLTTEQTANRRDVCLDLLDRLEREPELFSRVITGDESWILEYDPETKHQIREWHTANSPRPKKARMNKSKIKSMIICFFWQSENRPQGIWATRTNCQSNFLSEVLERLRKWVMLCDQALHALGCCTTTTSHVTRQYPSMNFWQKKAILLFLSPPLCRISVPVTYFYSSGSKTT